MIWPEQNKKNFFHQFEFVAKLNLETQNSRRDTSIPSVSAGLCAEGSVKLHPLCDAHFPNAVSCICNFPCQLAPHYFPSFLWQLASHYFPMLAPHYFPMTVSNNHPPNPSPQVHCSNINGIMQKKCNNGQVT